MSNLLPGENLIVKDHPHWVVLIKSVLIPVVLVILVLIADFTVLGPNNVYVPHLRTYLSLGGLALALLWLIGVWIRWQSTTYMPTDQRLKSETAGFGGQKK